MERGKKVLVTGGPVHAHLDSVKIVTNTFRGWRMEELAVQLQAAGHDVLYLGARHALTSNLSGRVQTLTHDGFADYHAKVLDLAPSMDAVVLGAAVANLVPAEPWAGKFPSHDYKPGDKVNIPFIVAPRVIDEVRAVAPRTKLFGFKLLDGVPRAELERAARETLKGARADLVIANDRTDLDRKTIVTPEGLFDLVHPLHEFLSNRILDEYYRTVLVREYGAIADDSHALALLLHRCTRFLRDGDHLHGAIAVRLPGDAGSFIAHARHKSLERDFVIVDRVDHAERAVYVRGQRKATRAAPLFAAVFAASPTVRAIVHSHTLVPDLPRRPYAPPGTAADVANALGVSFRINGHGSFWLLDEHDEVIR